jgi:putative protease
MQDSSQNQKKIPLPELLAPAGSFDAFRAALAAGADAVYLSGKRFGARKFARNFTDTEIEEAVRLAHRHDVRVYITLNTLIHDRELEGVAEYLHWLYSVGVDAVLIQDIGLVALAREIVPLLPLHASTQLTIHNTAGVRWAAEQGFSRVVLARELTLEEITRIGRETAGLGIGLEVFAHGALCYCYSGQCLLSSVIGGRSGNRGMCAQPCRKPYTMVYADLDEFGRPVGIHEGPSPEPYLLSPQDLCTYQDLPLLVNAPIASLKIEGRMKSPEYVSVVVSTYRRALDAIAAGKAYASEAALQDLCLAFNRGFTAGYLFGKRGDKLMGRDAPDSRGILVGQVKQYDAASKTIRLTNPRKIPSTGDGLLLTHPKDPVHEFGFSLNTRPREDDGDLVVRVPRRVEPGTRMFITSSPEFESRARQIVTHPSSLLLRPVPLDVHVRVDASGTVEIEGMVHCRGGREIPVMFRPEASLVPARTHPVSREQIVQHLKKSGDTPFAIRNFMLTYAGGLFIPVSGLNRMRRDFFALAEEKMVADFLPGEKEAGLSRQRLSLLKQRGVIPAGRYKRGLRSAAPLVGVYADSLECVKGAADERCDVVYFEPLFVREEKKCHVPVSLLPIKSQIAAALEMCRDAGARLVLRMPRITKNNYPDWFLPVLADGTGQSIAGYMVDNVGTAYALMNLRPAPALFGSTGLNIFNHMACCHLSPLFTSLTLSPELSGREIGDLIAAARSRGCVTSFSLLVQGNIEVMVSEDTLYPYTGLCNGSMKDPEFAGIRDVTGHIFPVRVDGECRSHLYNASELCLIDHLPSLMKEGIDEIIIDARGRTRVYAGDMTRLYKNAVRLVQDKETGDNQLEPLKAEVKLRSLGGITAGHYLRGLKE